MERADSKAAGSTCQGVNHTNGRMCRRAVSPNKVDRYCHLHRDQAHGRSPQRGPLVPMAEAPRHVSGLSHRTPTALSSPRRSEARQSSTDYRSHTTRHSDVAREPEKPAVLYTTVRPPGVVDPPVQRSFLGRLFSCVPSRPARAADLTASPPLTPGEKRVPRKPVMYGAVAGESTTSVATSDRAAQIAKDYEEITRLTQGLTIQQPQDKRLIEAHRLEKTYLDPAHFTHISRTTFERLSLHVRGCITRRHGGGIANELGSVARPHDPPHYIYLYRGDGDYRWTPRLLCKIGRARDPLERMYQWRQQCGRELELLDQMPTRFDALVERLVHLEFAERNVPQSCGSISDGTRDSGDNGCGRVHREWFELDRAGAKTRFRTTVAHWVAFAEELALAHTLDSAGRTASLR